MRIACPSCATEYDVPETRLKPGKMVRCARCGGEWIPPEEAAAAELSHAPEDPPPDTVQYAGPDDTAETLGALPPVTAMDRLAASPASVPRRSTLTAAWVLTAIVLIAAVAATIIWRDTIVRIWPPSGWILPGKTHTESNPAPNLPKKPE